MVEGLGNASQARLAAYLRKYAPNLVGHLDDEELLAHVRRQEKEAKGLNIDAESSVGMWSFMQTTSTNDLAREPFVVRFLADPRHGATTDERLDALFSLRTDLLRRKFG